MPRPRSAATCLRDRPLFNAFSTAPCQYSSRRISPIVSLRCCSKCYQRSGIKPRQVQSTRLGAIHISEKRSDRRLRAQKCVFCASDGCLLSYRRLSANIFAADTHVFSRQQHAPDHEEKQCGQDRRDGNSNDPGRSNAQQKIAFHQFNTVYTT